MKCYRSIDPIQINSWLFKPTITFLTHVCPLPQSWEYLARAIRHCRDPDLLFATPQRKNTSLVWTPASEKERITLCLSSLCGCLLRFITPCWASTACCWRSGTHADRCHGNGKSQGTSWCRNHRPDECVCIICVTDETRNKNIVCMHVYVTCVMQWLLSWYWFWNTELSSVWHLRPVCAYVSVHSCPHLNPFTRTCSTAWCTSVNSGMHNDVMIARLVIPQIVFASTPHKQVASVIEVLWCNDAIKLHWKSSGADTAHHKN